LNHYCCSCTKKSSDNSNHLSSWRQNTVFSGRQSSAILSVERFG